MSKRILSLCVFAGFILSAVVALEAQTDPAITVWLQNNSIKGRHYMKGNPTPIEDNVLANVQKVQYSDDWVYIYTRGIPAYITGPFLDGNPSLATDRNAIFRFPRKPVKNTGTPVNINLGNIGNFINGVALFDARDAASWSTASNSMKGGPFGGMGDNVWNRDAIPAERIGFDCAKAHPAMGNYHHHQNPSSFNLDLEVISNVCDLYPSDGLYVIDSTKHSPLLGFAYDGFPIYGAYGYKNADGTGGIVRIKSGWELRNISKRTTLWTGETVKSGPDVNSTYPLGYFREDYGYVASSDPAVLDRHNGRFCITPEYPQGTYCYFATVDKEWNSAYPYAVGPTYYGTKVAGKVTSVNEVVTTYIVSTSSTTENGEAIFVTAFPNPASDVLAIQVGSLVRQSVDFSLIDAAGRVVQTGQIVQGSTMSVLDVSTLYAGTYTLLCQIGGKKHNVQVVIRRE
jgi:hypothetical protein